MPKAKQSGYTKTIRIRNLAFLATSMHHDEQNSILNNTTPYMTIYAKSSFPVPRYYLAAANLGPRRG